MVHGDWKGAIWCTLLPAGAVYAVGLTFTLFYAVVTGELAARALVTAPATAVAIAFGASWQVTLGEGEPGDIFGSAGDLSYDVRAYPLLFSALAVWLLARSARRRFTAGHCAETLLARLTQAARVALLLGSACLVLAVASRQPVGDNGHLNAEYPLAFIGGLLIGFATVAVTALRHDPGQAPPVWRRFEQAVTEPLLVLRLAVPVIVLAGILAVLGSVVFGGMNEDLSMLGVDTNTSQSVGAALVVPYAPNIGWMVFGIVIGAPLQISAGAGLGLNDSTSLLDLAGGTAGWWVAPFAALAVLFACGVLLAVRSPSAHQARRRVAVWSLTFAAASLTLAYVGMATVRLRSPFGGLDASIGNELVLVAVLSWAWSLLAGLGGVGLVKHLAPQTRLRWARWAGAPRDVLGEAAEPPEFPDPPRRPEPPEAPA